VRASGELQNLRNDTSTPSLLLLLLLLGDLLGLGQCSGRRRRRINNNDRQKSSRPPLQHRKRFMQECSIADGLQRETRTTKKWQTTTKRESNKRVRTRNSKTTTSSSSSSGSHGYTHLAATKLRNTIANQEQARGRVLQTLNHIAFFFFFSYLIKQLDNGFINENGNIRASFHQIL
jgi:hypothetical protein